MDSYLFVTFKVTADGERGHPMDHILTRVDLTPDGLPTGASMQILSQRIRREVRSKTAGVTGSHPRGRLAAPDTGPKPTPAQSRVLLEAIYTRQPLQPKAGAAAHRLHANLLRGGWIKNGLPTAAAYKALGVTRAPVSEQVHCLNGSMLARLRRCAADTSSNWDGKVTIYPPEARDLVSLIDAAIGESDKAAPDTCPSLSEGGADRG